MTLAALNVFDLRGTHVSHFYVAFGDVILYLLEETLLLVCEVQHVQLQSFSDLELLLPLFKFPLEFLIVQVWWEFHVVDLEIKALGLDVGFDVAAW